ncbi:hypothetical protein M8J75_006578 [Diaphorina citri]|nr:hypothetical protein M8J75_006578 [Diaphorina citri]
MSVRVHVLFTQTIHTPNSMTASNIAPAGHIAADGGNVTASSGGNAAILNFPEAIAANGDKVTAGSGTDAGLACLLLKPHRPARWIMANIEGF